MATKKLKGMKRKKVRHFLEKCINCEWKQNLEEQGTVSKRCPCCGDITRLSELKSTWKFIEK